MVKVKTFLLLLLLSACLTAEPVRLPRPRRDVNIWGALINQFLRVSHNEDGTLKTTALEGLLAEEVDPCFTEWWADYEPNDFETDPCFAIWLETFDNNETDPCFAVWYNNAAPTLTSLTIDTNILDTTEWAYLDGQDQRVDVNASPSFAGLTTGDVNVNGSGTREAMRILQGADLEGFELYGFDDQDGNSIKIFIDGAGGANIRSSRYTVYKVGGNNVIVFNPSSFDVYQKMRMLDDVVQSFGTGKDYSWVYDESTDTLQLIDGFTPGSNIRLQLDSSGNILVFNKLAFTQTDLNEYIDSLNDGYMDYGATTGHRFSGGLTVDTDALVVDAVNDRVGIGTSSPNSVFHIKASIPGIIGSHHAGQLIIQNPTDSVFSNVVITAYESDGGGNPDQQLWYLGSASSGNTDITFLNRRTAKLTLGTSGTSRITILGNGNVGINETAPQDKLEVNGTVLVKDKLKFTQDDGLEYIDSLADGYMDYGATTEHRFNNDVNVTGAITATTTVTAEQLTSTDDITMQGHLLTMGDVGAATDTVVDFLGSLGSGKLTWDTSAQLFELDSSAQIVKNSGSAPFFKINTTLQGTSDEVYFETNSDSDGSATGPVRTRLQSQATHGEVGTYTLHGFDIVRNSVVAIEIDASGNISIGNVANSNVIQISAVKGNLSFAGDSGFYPRFLTQAAEPAAGTGTTQCDTSEMVVWKDSDDSKTYLCFNDGGTVKTAELL